MAKTLTGEQPSFNAMYDKGKANMNTLLPIKVNLLIFPTAKAIAHIGSFCMFTIE